MTPAESPRARESALVLVRLVKKARALPIPVESPANRVSPKARRMSSLNMPITAGLYLEAYGLGEILVCMIPA